MGLLLCDALVLGVAAFGPADGDGVHDFAGGMGCGHWMGEAGRGILTGRAVSGRMEDLEGVGGAGEAG